MSFQSRKINQNNPMKIIKQDKNPYKLLESCECLTLPKNNISNINNLSSFNKEFRNRKQELDTNQNNELKEGSMQITYDFNYRKNQRYKKLQMQNGFDYFSDLNTLNRNEEKVSKQKSSHLISTETKKVFKKPQNIPNFVERTKNRHTMEFNRITHQPNTSYLNRIGYSPKSKHLNNLSLANTSNNLQEYSGMDNNDNNNEDNEKDALDQELSQNNQIEPKQTDHNQTINNQLKVNKNKKITIPNNIEIFENESKNNINKLTPSDVTPTDAQKVIMKEGSDGMIHQDTNFDIVERDGNLVALKNENYINNTNENNEKVKTISDYQFNDFYDQYQEQTETNLN